jgi:hypothetical protein
MTAPIASNIQLPDDTGNAGKKVRTETKSIGGITVHEHFMVPTVGMTVLGKYFFSSTQQTVAAAAQNATSTGFFWLQMPVAATATALIRSVNADYNLVGTTAFPTAPVISFSKFTFTGTASGASVTALPYKTGGTVNQMIVQTAVTGMTVTVVNDFGALSIPGLATAVGAFGGSKQIIPKSPIAYERGMDLEIGPGEGIVIYQTQAGSGSDTRKFVVQLEWLELDLS